MAETAQPPAAENDSNGQLQSAADAFKAFTSDLPVAQPRDDRGRFATGDEDDEIAALDEAASGVDDIDDAAEAADPAQPDPIAIPASWSKDDAELWQSLPPEAQARIAGREGERERAVNQKFQEAANARRGYEHLLAAANANRDNYATAIDEVLNLVAPQRPDPRAYGAGTGEYDRESYDLALAEFEQHSEILHALHQQRHAIAAQQAAEAEAVAHAAHEAIEAAWRPRFLALLPDIADPAKGGPALQALVQYAVDNGIEPALFEDPRAAQAITSAELAILEKARRYDAIKAAEGKVRANPAPRTATPTARPGVALSRSAQRASQVKAANQRLAREGSIEAGAAMWKHFL